MHPRSGFVRTRQASPKQDYFPGPAAPGVPEGVAAGAPVPVLPVPEPDDMPPEVVPDVAPEPVPFGSVAERRSQPPSNATTAAVVRIKVEKEVDRFMIVPFKVVR